MSTQDETNQKTIMQRIRASVDRIIKNERSQQIIQVANTDIGTVLVCAFFIFLLGLYYILVPTFKEYMDLLFKQYEMLFLIPLGGIAFCRPDLIRKLNLENRKVVALSIFSICIFLSGFSTWKTERDKYMSPVFGQLVPVVRIDPGPYSISKDEYLLSVASSPDKQTVIELPRDPYVGERFEIKDANGYAEKLNIIVEGNGHKIDGNDKEPRDTYPIYTNFMSIVVTFDGSQWLVT